ncbi:MAG: DUF177 domain-containing protein [Paludibacteraceae bacterium]
MGKFSVYNIPLKDLSKGTHNYEFNLDNVYFKNIEGDEVQKGNVKAIVEVTRTSQSFEINFDIKGVIQIPCDRCLDDMDQEIDTQNQLTVKFGSEYAEESDKIIVVPEEEGEINLAWFLYEFIALNIPIRHVHPAGKCTKSMVSKLKKHLAHDKNEEEEPIDFLDDEDLDIEEGETGEEESKTDPRWDGLKKLITEDNNN